MVFLKIFLFGHMAVMAPMMSLIAVLCLRVALQPLGRCQQEFTRLSKSGIWFSWKTICTENLDARASSICFGIWITGLVNMLVPWVNYTVRPHFMLSSLLVGAVWQYGVKSQSPPFFLKSYSLTFTEPLHQ